MSKRWLQSLVCGFAALLAAAPALASDTIKIAVSGPQSGELASYGIPSLNAAQLVAEEYNAKGGIMGRQIEILAYDDLCRAEVATAVATKMLSDGVHAVMGPNCSGACKATMPLFTAANVITMSPSATTPALTLSGANPTFFRTVANDDDSAIIGAAFVRDELKVKKLAILHDNSEYGRGYAEKVQQELQKSGGVEIVLFEAVTPGATDYSSSVRKVAQARAEAIMWGGYYPEAAKILANMYTANLEIPMVGPDGLKDMGFVELAGEDAEGVYASGPTDTSANPLSVYYAKKHQEKYGTAPGAFFDTAASATIALINAMDVAQSTETKSVMDALHSSEVDTPIGRIKFDQHGDAVGVGMSIYEIADQQYKEVYKH